MGEELYGTTKLYVGEQEIDLHPQECIALEYDIPTGDSLVALDPAQDDGDKTVASLYHNGSITMSFSIKSDDNPIGKWFLNEVRRLRRERNTLLWALTHGYTIRVPCMDDDGNDGHFDLTLPSHLRQLMRITKFIPNYRIYDRDGFLCVIRKGKVKYKAVWPATHDVIDEYEKRFRTKE